MLGYLAPARWPPIFWTIRQLDAVLGRIPPVAKKSYHIVVSFSRPASG
jgi:hypothetical protein